MENTIRELLIRLESCSSSDFNVMVHLYIDHILENAEIKSGGGWLVELEHDTIIPFRVEVSAHSPPEERLLTFVHEVFHIPFVNREIFDLDTKNQELHTLLEDGIDKISEVFFRDNFELVTKLYSALIRP